MFKRIAYEDWTSIVPYVAFGCTFFVFLYFLIRAIRMKREERERMGRLPLDDSPPPNPHKHDNS